MLLIVGVITIVFGVAAIIMGFFTEYPNAHDPGAIFFIGGWMVIGLDRIAWRLDRFLEAISRTADASDAPGASDPPDASDEGKN